MEKKSEAVALKTNCTCPSCKTSTPLATNLSGEHVQPENGDMSVCYKCGSVNIFDSNLDVVIASDDEIADFKLTSPDAYVMMRRVVKIITNESI